MMTRIYLIALFLSACSLTCTAQEQDGFWNHGVGKLLKTADGIVKSMEHRGFDTAYVKVPERDRMFFIGTNVWRQNYDLHIPVSLQADDYPLFVQGYLPSNLSELMYVEPRFRATKVGVTAGVNWRGVSIQLPLPVSNSYSRSYVLATNGSRFGFRLMYRTVDNVTGMMSNPFGDLNAHIINTLMDDVAKYGELREHHEPYYAKDHAIEDGSMNLRNFYAETYYVFNSRRFSLAAAQTGSKMQMRSAGSLLAMANYFQVRLGCNDLLNYKSDVFRNDIVSLGLGYGYNLSLLKGRLCLHGSFIPMLSLYNHLTHKGVDGTIAIDDIDEEQRELAEALIQMLDNYRSHFYNAVDFDSSSRFNVSGNARFAINYFFDRYMVRLLLTYRTNIFHNSYDMTMKNGEANLRVALGYRF